MSTSVHVHPLLHHSLKSTGRVQRHTDNICFSDRPVVVTYRPPSIIVEDLDTPLELVGSAHQPDRVQVGGNSGTDDAGVKVVIVARAGVAGGGDGTVKDALF